MIERQSWAWAGGAGRSWSRCRRTAIRSASSPGATRTVSPEVQAFAEAQKLTLAKTTRRCSRTRRRRGGAGDAALAACRAGDAAAQAGKHVFCEKPFALTRPMPKRRWPRREGRASRSASATTAASIPR